MNKIIAGLLAIGGMFLILLGMVFVIAGGSDVLVGGLMLLVGFVLLIFVYLGSRQEAQRPQVVQQTWNVHMDGAGQFAEKQLRCASCGAPLKDENLKVVEGGVMVSCPFCGKVAALEEQPKW